MNRSRSISATPEGLTKVGERMAQLEQPENLAKPRKSAKKGWTQQNLADRSGVSIDTVKRFLKGNPVDRKFIIWITEALGLEITQIVDPKDWNPAEQTSEAIDWREVCGKVLAKQQENQRLRRQATERGFELNVYVPLGLVERKQQQRRRGDVPLEEVYQLTQEVITKEYDNDKFLTEVIEPGKSDRIAIIGEPGAGKTTLQEKIAVWMHDNNRGLPICIPLGGLQGKSVEEYLLQIWLKAALRFIEPDVSGVEVRHIVSLQKQFREGKVWLLLDGVDEMATTSPVEALATIKEQLTDWLVEARVVLTCRLNVWDANVNTILTGFETYRTLEFKPEQVEDFIRQWFTCAKESQRGEELLKKLQETGKERIRELVRNPLRLSLLCQTSYLLPVDEPLPETKAALYDRFTRYFYEWKQEQHPTTRTERRQLNQALGELAKAGINSAVRFRLGEDLACDVMGEPLFDLACRLGWLNLVDREAKTDEAVYAFFHPTFQEYFAACAIDDWRYFLNHDNENPNPLLNPNPSLEYDGGKPAYRIFEPQWKEVILIWLGRTDILQEQKENFIYALVNFKDGVSPFYRFQAFFLSAASIAEFQDFKYWNPIDAIVSRIVSWGFGHFDSNTHGWFMPVNSHISEKARAVLQESNRSTVIKKLTQLLVDYMNILNELVAICKDEEIPTPVVLGYDGALLDFVIVVALTLLKLEPTNSYAVKTLTDIKDTFYMDMTIHGLMSMAEDFKQLINISKSYLPSSQQASQLSGGSSDSTYNPSVEEILNGRIEIDAVNDLIKEISNNQEPSKNIEALLKLRRILPGKSSRLVVEGLKKFLQDLVPNQQNWLIRGYCIEIMHCCAQNMYYPDFYQAWHQTTIHQRG